MRKVLEERATEVVGRVSEHGNSTMDVLCPFCEKITTAFIWSISANGKVCETEDCDVILYRDTAHKLFPKITEKQREVLKDLCQFKCASIGDGWHPNRRVLKSLLDKGLVAYGKWPPNEAVREIGYYPTELGKRYFE
ncbi:hypothetical protein ACXIVA_20390 [Vibrio parahaemolyticus]